MLDRIIQIIGFVFFGFAIYLIGKEVDRIGAVHLWHLIISTPWWVVVLVFFFTFLDYIALFGYDWLSLEYVKRKISIKEIVKASSIGFAISNTTGHAYAAGGSVRYLFYTPLGLSHIEIVKIIAFESITILMGMALAYVVAIGASYLNPALDGYAYLPYLKWSALAVVLAILLYYWIFVRSQKVFHVAAVDIQTPSLLMTSKQFFVGFMDNLMVCLVFYAALRYHMDADFITVFIVFIVAQTIAITTQVPGGVGVFEGLFLFLFPHAIEHRPAVLASLAIYRVLYFFVPFFLAGLYLIALKGLNYIKIASKPERKS